MRRKNKGNFMTALQERSRRIIDVWNSAVILRSRIKFFPYIREDEVQKWQERVDKLRSELDGICGKLKQYQLEKELDLKYAPTPEYRSWLAYVVEPGITFETLCANIGLLLSEILGQIIEMEEIGIDTVTGLKIYYERVNKKYVLFDDMENKVKETFDKLGIIVTYSIDTGGMGAKEQLIAEVSAWTFVVKMGREDITEVEDKISEFIIDSVEKNFGTAIANVAMKAGVEYSSKTNIAYRGKTIITANYPHIELIHEYRHRSKKTRRDTHPTRTLRDYA